MYTLKNSSSIKWLQVKSLSNITEKKTENHPKLLNKFYFFPFWYLLFNSSHLVSPYRVFVFTIKNPRLASAKSGGKPAIDFFRL